MNNKTIEQRVLNFITRENLLSPGDRVLLTLSGGSDSVFAFHFLRKYRKRLGITFAAVHINHGLRGKESDLDEDFCRSLCRRSGIELFIKHVDVKNRRANRKESIEEAARALRYNVFEKLSARENFNKIITAHNMTDNAETVMLNMLKGAGLSGARGIPLRRDNRFIRPFLCLSKKEITRYLQSMEFSFRTDKSNDSDDFQRNIIRNKLFPVIEKMINPEFEKALFKSSLNIAAQEKALGIVVEELTGKFCTLRNSAVFIKTEAAEIYGLELFSEIARNVCAKFFDLSLNEKDTAKFLKLYSSQTGTSVGFRKNITAVRERKQITVASKVIDKSVSAVSINFGKDYHTGDFSIKLEKIENGKEIKFSKKFELISADKCSGNFILRKWKTGDKFKPLGMSKFKKISDFLTEIKIPASTKKNQFVLENNGNIVYVVGYRIDDRFKITSSTKEIIKIWIKS